MGNSLLDQLKNAGLVNEQQAHKAKKQKSKQAKQQRNAKTKVEDPNKQRVQQAQAEKVARDRELNRQQKEAAERKAINAQIKQLVESNRIEDGDGELAYNFTDGSKIKNMYVNERMQDLLVRGRVAIVKQGDRYILVPAAVAEKISQRDASRVILSNETGQEPEGDDPYADYVIPDDLMW